MAKAGLNSKGACFYRNTARFGSIRFYALKMEYRISLRFTYQTPINETYIPDKKILTPIH